MSEDDDYSLFDDSDAYAKRDDPETSWEAADALGSEQLRKRLKAVYDVLKDYGPCHNDDLVEFYQQSVQLRGFPPQTDQSVRSRRSELTARGLCVDTGRRFVLDTGRKAVVWAAV